ncbi:hypothetical protein BS17DRAFT_762875 [Gyrodon lividus]|nr:hypothetical protein BS17DRAFT_762875 [Gyrodon lividus]
MFLTPLAESSTSSPSRLSRDLTIRNHAAAPSTSQASPSEGWLNNPAWIDGGVNPPCFYHSKDEIAAALRAACRSASAQPPPLVLIEEPGHLISICMIQMVPENSLTNGRAKTLLKKQWTIKSDHIKLSNIGRTDFIKAWLKAHDLDEQFSPGVHSGPEFRMWWTGSSGGKAGATTVANDHDFGIAKASILKKKKDSCVVNMEFDVDMMDDIVFGKGRFLVVTESHRRRMNSCTELEYVPCVDLFTEDTQLHGPIIMQLKKRWVCEKHAGKHGEPGYCFFNACSEHLGLNHRKLKLWAATIAAEDATKHEPPIIEFDCLRDGRLDGHVKPRGRSGPHSRTPSSTSPDATSLLLAAVIPLLTNHLVPKTSDSTTLPMTPTKPHESSHRESLPLSPVPPAGSKIHACLEDFFRVKGVDLQQSEEALTDLDLTPDIIADIPISRLNEVLNTVEGRTHKYQAFTKEWLSHLQCKKRRLN